ncbi:hypothetical protein P7K49_024926 [Saguinus oedipus]|uniref:Homeobox domain-containing protein n=1 Tax=Saguinus oedipus TaxID=9490 RepID=A0ABQ9UFM3_SAGOE|nr:hypothetical protein P7K49_024926 [Saguinus oedipus]
MLSPLLAGLGLVCPRGSAFLHRVGKAGGTESGNRVWGQLYVGIGGLDANNAAEADLGYFTEIVLGAIKNGKKDQDLTLERFRIQRVLGALVQKYTITPMVFGGRKLALAHPGEAQENTIASSLTAKLNPGLLYPARFEKLDITPKSAQKIKPVLERWMAEAEARHRAGMQNLTEFIGSEPSKKRKRRTSFTPQALEILNAHFEKNTHPSGQEMTEIAEKLNYDREVVRVWFCNKRQALKNTIKRLKQHEPATAVPLEPLTDSLEENS